MRFVVEEKVFSVFENVCFGVVFARGVDNTQANPASQKLLADSIRFIEEKFAAAKVKEADEIAPYREAFVKIGLNPNKFMSSIEAMATRIEKKKGFPSINPVVDLGNALSLKHLVPLGVHDVDGTAGDICVRFSRAGDRFIPFGETEEELLDSGELIYSVGDKVKTRRWIWRQSEEGKVTETSKNIFFPIDGFTDRNYRSVLAARDELAELLQRLFNCRVQVGFVDKSNREIEIEV
ncbi:MAG: phenylalanine--tRNA ligase beta subunit-related protein [Negativicutes bacterium]|nr:phenylalanine--tRNA ligase beta subunit-related protein [Negativicutes bacterium]